MTTNLNLPDIVADQPWTLQMMNNATQAFTTHYNSTDAVKTAALDSLGKVSTAMADAIKNIGNEAPPKLEDLDDPEIDADIPEPPEAPDFDSELGEVPPAPDIASFLGDLDLDPLPLPDAPPAPTMVLPNTPAPIDTTGMPSRPDLGDEVEVPEAPDLIFPELNDLKPIEIPEFVFPELPTFDKEAPVFDLADPQLTFAWAEPEYAPEILDQVTGRVSSMLTGGTGLPVQIEQALFDRTMQREDKASNKAVSEAFETFAARNFSLPPGALAKQVASVQEANRGKASEINREVLIEAAKWEIESLRFAVQQGIAIENVMVNIFENATKRAFEVSRFLAESQVKLYEMFVSVYNARMQAYQIEASVHKTNLEAAALKIEAYKAAIQAQAAIGQLNEQYVKIYTARLQGLTTHVEVYKARMSAAQIQADLIKTQLETYRTDIQAYAERIQADKTRFEAYKIQMDGEIAKTNVYEASTRAYSAVVQAVSAQSELQIKGITAKIEAAKGMLMGYQAEVEAFKAKSEMLLKKADLQNTVFKTQADLTNVTGQMALKSAELEATVAEANGKIAVARAEIESKNYGMQLQKALAIAQMSVESQKALGGWAAQLAAGAMSAMHLSAQIGGSAAANTSNQYSYSTQHEYKHDGGS